MLTKMTEEDWEIVLEVFDAAQSERGEPGHDDRKFLEALHYFTVHSITWRRNVSTTMIQPGSKFKLGSSTLVDDLDEFRHSARRVLLAELETQQIQATH